MRTIHSTSRLLLSLSVSAAGVFLASCSDYSLNPRLVTLPEKKKPVITWAQPAPITNPAPLGPAQLNATADVPGSFAYSPASGTVLSAGAHRLTATFTPRDSEHYNAATASVSLTVKPGQPSTRLAVSDNFGRVVIYNEPLADGESASIVLGQPDMNTSIDISKGATSMPPNRFLPARIAADPQGDLFVTDWVDCRVLEFRPPFTTFMNASVAFGQRSLTETCAENPSGPTALFSPFAVAVDPNGDLWVSDVELSQIVEYVPPFSTGMAPSVVMGKGLCEIDISSRDSSATSLCDPTDIAFDPDGNLWVADEGFDRILEFKPPFSTGMAASLELGQASFTSQDSCNDVSSTCFNTVDAMAFDPKGNLWIAQLFANRILEIKPPFATGMAASLVLGQPDFTTPASHPPSAKTFTFYQQGYGGVGLSFDQAGNLLVSDALNMRVLIFEPPFNNYMNATTVLGQPDMTSRAPGLYTCPQPTAASLCFPWSTTTF